METMLARAAKIEKRTQRASEISKSVSLNLRQIMARSEKPKKEKKKVVQRELT